MKRNYVYLLLIIGLFVTSCQKDEGDNPSPESSKENTESLLLGDWYTGPGIKHFFNDSLKTGDQNLAASNNLVTYNIDGTVFNRDRGSSETYEVNSNGDEIIIAKGLAEERVYRIEEITADSLVVYGPFTTTGEHYEQGVLYTLTHYRNQSENPEDKSIILGEWITGPGVKHFYSGDTETGTQELGASNNVITYNEDGTHHNRDRGTSETYEINEAGDEILISKGTDEERVYKIQKLTEDSLIVFGPFTSSGEHYEEGILYTLTHIRNRNTVNEPEVKSLILGEWSAGSGIKYFYNGDTETGTQELNASGNIITYNEDGTQHNRDRGSSETYEINEAGDEIVISKGLAEERVYNIEQLTEESLVVYGPFTSSGGFYENGVLYRLTYSR